MSFFMTLRQTVSGSYGTPTTPILFAFTRSSFGAEPGSFFIKELQVAAIRSCLKHLRRQVNFLKFLPQNCSRGSADGICLPLFCLSFVLIAVAGSSPLEVVVLELMQLPVHISQLEIAVVVWLLQLVRLQEAIAVIAVAAGSTANSCCCYCCCSRFYGQKLLLILLLQLVLPPEVAVDIAVAVGSTANSCCCYCCCSGFYGQKLLFLELLQGLKTNPLFLLSP